MVRSLRWLVLSLVGSSVMAGTSAGLSISIVSATSTGSSPTTLAVGDILTIDLVAHNEAGLGIAGLGLIAFGYDADSDGLPDDGLWMTRADAVSSIFNTARAEDGEVSGGLENFGTYEDLGYATGGVLLGLQTQLFSGISFRPSDGDGSLDMGLEGLSIADGGVHFRISFQATSLLDPTVLTLRFGTGPTNWSPPFSDQARGQGAVILDGATVYMLPFEDASLTVAILADPNARSGDPFAQVPESGTSLMVGFGLAMLGASRPARAIR